jgi:hypothetical protein
MSLLQKLKGFFLPDYPELKEAKPLPDEETDRVVESVELAPQGHIVQVQRPRYNPDITRRGGRVVKAMPRNLKKIKQAQERPLDD